MIRRPGLDVQAALTVLGRFPLIADVARADLVGGYVRWHNRHARPKRRFAANSKIRRPDYLPNVA